MAKNSAIFFLNGLAIHHLQDLQDSLKAKRIGERPYKGASVNKYVGALRAMLKDARRTGALLLNLFDPDLFSKLPETDSESEIDPYLPEEREKILKGFLDHRRHYHAFVFHQFWTGCRPSEACALRRRDIDLAYGWERIEKSRVAGNERGTKTGPSNRQIRLHENLVDVLKDHIRFMLEPEAYLFTTSEGAPIDESNFYKREWLPMLCKLKIRPRGFYNTRHSYASFMLSIGTRMNFISAQTGDSEETLKKHYAKYIEGIDPQREWIENQIRESAKSEKSAQKGEKSGSAAVGTSTPKMKKPSKNQGLSRGAGEEGRTPDLMLGKHTL
jgi:integrase